MNSIARQVRTVSDSIEGATRASVFSAVAKSLAASGGGMGGAVKFAEANRLPRGVVEILKSGVAAGSLGGSEGDALADFGVAARAWLDSLRSLSAFDSMLPWMVKVPLRTRVNVTTLGATAYVRGEGEAKTISSLELAAGGLDVISVVAWVVLSKELAAFAGPDGSALFDKELKAGVASATDSRFISILTNGLQPITSSGSSVAAARADLAAALAGIEMDARSQVFVLTTSKIVKALAMANTESGSTPWPDLGVQGGTISGMRVIPTSAVADGEIVVVDAAQIVAASEKIELKKLQHASVQMSAPPDSPATASTVMVDLWSNDLVAISAERYFGAFRGRDSAAAVITGVSYSGDSPA